MKKIHFLTCLVFIAVVTGFSWFFRTYSVDASEASQEQDNGKYSVHSFQSEKEAATFWSSLLSMSWHYYKTKFMAENTSRVISNHYGGTISEGQSYALLKALWMEDPKTFERVWHWTRTQMKRPNDHLLGWRWGENPSGLIETENASDADQDIAYALLQAGWRWNRPDFTEDGLAMVKDIWRYNVAHLNGRYYLNPGTWSGFNQNHQLTLNPSYFAPYVYQTFAHHDVEHAEGWRQLAEDTYDTLEACTALSKVGLPPNWCAVSTLPDKNFKPAAMQLHTPVQVIFSDVQGLGARDFSYDAFRVFWRMQMDSKLSPAPERQKAIAYIKRHGYLLRYWQKKGITPEGFTAEGLPRGDKDSGFAAAPTLVVSHTVNPNGDSLLYDALLGSHYNPEGYWFNDYNDFLHSVIWLHLYAIQLH
jgi:hypothetical protein